MLSEQGLKLIRNDEASLFFPLICFTHSTRKKTVLKRENENKKYVLFFHAACEDNTFGADCSENCSITCAGPNNNCDHVNGSCIFGCDHGYQGETCKNCK